MDWDALVQRWRKRLTEGTAGKKDCKECNGTGYVEASEVYVGYYPGKIDPCECWYCSFCQSPYKEDGGCNCDYYRS